METESKQLPILLKALGKVTVETLPEIIELVPGYGPLFSKILSKTLGLVGGYEDERSESDFDEQINLLKKSIQENKITDNDFRIIVQKEMMDYLKKNEQRMSVYMFGIALFPFSFESINEDDISAIDDVLTIDDLRYESEKIQEYVEKIQGFCFEYNGDGPLYKDDDYYVTSDSLTINFYTEYEHFKRSDSEILDFIDNLNSFLERPLFGEYIIF